MRKMKVASSSHALTKKRKNLQDYFDLNHNNIVTPNQRSLPKYKNVFHPPKHHKSAKKDHLAQRKMSQGRIDRKQKENHSPPHHHNHHRYGHLEQSLHRDYDSPSKDQEDIGFIVKGVQKKVKGNTFIENTIEQVNQQLRANQLS